MTTNDKTETLHEMNLWDVCKSIARGIADTGKALLRLLANMIRLTYRFWWITGITIAIAIACSLYYTRESNRRYKATAIVCINGPAVSEVQNWYEALEQNFPAHMTEEQTLISRLGLDAEQAAALSHFRSFRVIDCMHDGTADYVDMKNRNNGTDTLQVRMEDQLALQFQTKDPKHLHQAEEAIMAYLNSNPQFQESFRQYHANATRQWQFDRQQIEKLDSLTSLFYQAASGIQTQTPSVNMAMGKREVVLFLDDIEEYFHRKDLRDHRYTLCTAPLTLQGHFVAAPRAVNGPLKCLALALIIGWCIGCILALMWEKRKQISAFLKQ